MRRLLLAVIVLMLTVASLHAQDNLIQYPALQDGDTIAASFEDSVTTHLYAFNGSADDSITINMTQVNDDLDPFLVVIDSNGAVIGFDDDSGVEPFSAEVTLSLDEDGVYFIITSSADFIDGFETDTRDVLPYILEISGNNTPETIEDADVVTLDAIVLSSGDSIRGETTEDTPVGLFFVEGAAGDVLVISLEDADFFTVLHVFAPNGDRLVVDPSFGEIDAEEDGAYLVIATEQFFYEAMNDNSFFEGGSFILVIE